MSMEILLQTPSLVRFSPIPRSHILCLWCEHIYAAPNPIPGSGVIPFLNPTFPVLCEHPNPPPNPIPGSFFPHPSIPHHLSCVNTLRPLQTPSSARFPPSLDPTLPVHGVNTLILLQTPSLARSPPSLDPPPLPAWQDEAGAAQFLQVPPPGSLCHPLSFQQLFPVCGCGCRSGIDLHAAFRPARGRGAGAELCQAAQTNKLRPAEGGRAPSGMPQPRAGWEKMPSRISFFHRGSSLFTTGEARAGWDGFGVVEMSCCLSPKGDTQGWLSTPGVIPIGGPQLGAVFHPKSQLWDTQLGGLRS